MYVCYVCLFLRMYAYLNFCLYVCYLLIYVYMLYMLSDAI